MTESTREPTIAGLLDQFEVIGGPELFGPEGLAIMVALWRKSSKLGWKQAFQMTNTELTLQTGIRSRDTINTHRSKLVNAGIIGYSPPPRGSSRGNYLVKFNLIPVDEPVRESDNFNQVVGEPVRNLDKVGGKVVQKPDHFGQVAREPVQKSDNYADTVLKDITTTPTTIDFAVENSDDSEQDGMIAILNAYCRLHGKLDFHVKPREREAMGRMVAGGMPVPFTISTMDSLLQAKREREGNDFRMPTSFLYYVDAINEAWRNSQTTSLPMAGVATGAPEEPPKRKTKFQRELEDLRRRAKEERQRGQSRSV